MIDKKIAFIGAGNMAGSIINGLVSNGYPSENICASTPSIDKNNKLVLDLNIKFSNNNIETANWSEVIVLCVKPQMMDKVCDQLRSNGAELSNKLIISIAAGITIARLESMLGSKNNIIRTMPNTPSLLKKGMTGLYASTAISAKDREFAGNLMNSVGEIIWVESEAMINSIIAVSGSAPAYFFLFMEAMQSKAIEMGFTPEQARALVAQTALGSASMVKENSDISLSTLRENVTSKGGTTAQAIETFNELKLNDIVAKAMDSAVKRAVEMEKLF